MAWALGALLAALLLTALVLAWPLRLDANGQARGEPDGSWAVAGGLSLGSLGVALVWARGISPQVSFLLFGKKVPWRPEWTKHVSRPIPKRVKKASSRLWARVEPLQLGLKLLEERRHARLRFLVLDLAYGFRDPLLTGRLVGAISALSAVLPAPIQVRQRPRWDFEDGWEIGLDARAIVRPWLALLDLLVYVVRQVRHERHQDRGRRPDPAQGRAGHLQERDDRGGTPAGR